MNENRKTLIFAAAAIVLALLAWLSAPSTPSPDAFFDQGETFFPDFVDPNDATTLEVVEFDEQTATAKPFKVTLQDNRWTIPSHHDYPADGADRLAATAASVIDIVKDDFRTDNVSDHEACGVLDPLDEGVISLKGLGKRVTIRGKDESALADLIIGKQVEGRSGYRFVRLPGQKRVYVSRIDADISARFEDWIERDLLQIDSERIVRIVLDDYRIDERSLRIRHNETVVLDNSDAGWRMEGLAGSRELDEAKVKELVRAIDELNIVGVRPKPEGLSAGLRRAEGLQLRQSDLASLQQKGYYLTRDGALMSNEGEVQVQTDQGILYTLRFGEVLYGRGEAITAGSEEATGEQQGPGENRYLFITAELMEDLLPSAPEQPSDRNFENLAEAEWSDADRRNSELATEWDSWRAEVDAARQLAQRLRDRFAGWYYVISADSFEKVRLQRNDLTKAKSN
jgi:hypothetical protein